MARYTNPGLVESEVWNLKFADLPRAQNRALIDDLFNGSPPFSEAEREEAGIKTNVNFLEPCKIAHDARRQYSNAFLTPGNFFNVSVDHGPVHRQREWSQIITTEINKKMKESLHYRETLRNVFAQVVLHGVGPCNWQDEKKWCPSMIMMGDLLVPSRTLLTMENLSKFAIKRRYTAEELYRLTHGGKVNSAWNMPVVERAIKWARNQTVATSNLNGPENPEMLVEDFKENSGFFSADLVPTIDCYDFYFFDENEGEAGWKRRIILDTFDNSFTPETKSIIGGRSEFLFDSGNRCYARKLSEILHFQFADGSSVAPFRFHTVRSLGFLLYSVCHLQNRLRCKFTDAAFEHMMQYLRVNDVEGAERALKSALIDKGILPDGMSFIPRDERWQIDMSIVAAAFGMNRQSMEDNASSYTQDFDFNRDNVEKTATQVTAEVTATSALVTSMLQEAYGYQEFQYREIARRFCIKNSRDLEAIEFRKVCLHKGVPEEALNIDRWTISAERIIGGGNKQMELAQVNMLMSQFQRFGPDAQRIILRDFAFAATSDPARTNELVPQEKNTVSSAKHDAQLAMGTLMLGLPVDVRPSMNHIDYVETILFGMAKIVQSIEASGGMATQEQVIGLNNTANHVAQHIQIIAQDPEEKQRVKKYGDVLGKLMNRVKAYQQRLQEQMGEQGQQGNPELMAKVESMVIAAQSKAKISEATAAQKLKHKEISFAQKTAQQQEKSQLENANEIRRTQVDEAAKDLTTASEIQRQSAKQPEGQAQLQAPKESGKPKKSIYKVKRGKDGAISEVEKEEQ